MRRFRSRCRSPHPLPHAHGTPAPCVCFSGHSGPVWRLAFLPCGAFVSGGEDGTIRIHRLTPGAKQLVLRGHAGEVSGVASLSASLLISVSLDQTARVWNTRTAEQVASVKFDLLPYAVHGMGEGRAVVGSGRGSTRTVYEVRWNGEALEKRLVGKGFVTKDGAVFAGREGEEILWRTGDAVNGEELTSPRGKLVDDRDLAGCEAMNEWWFVDWSTVIGLRVLETATWREKGQFLKKSIVWDARCVAGGNSLLVCSHKGLTLLDVVSGRSLWHRRFHGAWSVLICEGGRVAVGTVSGNVFVVDVPEDVAKKAGMRNTEERRTRELQTPMGDALCRLLQGEGAGNEISEYVMRDGMFPGSMEEWACGHWLVMVGLRDGRYASGDELGMEERWWRKELYADAARFECGGVEEAEAEAMKAYMEEAREAGVVDESVEVVRSVRGGQGEQSGCGVREAILRRCEAVMKGEKKMERLEACVERYGKGEVFSGLLCAALVVVGVGMEGGRRGGECCEAEGSKTVDVGALPGALREVWSGRQECGSVKEFCGRVFRGAVEVLTDEAGVWVDEETRLQIVRTLEEQKMGVEELCRLFEEHVVEAEEVRSGEDESGVCAGEDARGGCELDRLRESVGAMRGEVERRRSELRRLTVLCAKRAETAASRRGRHVQVSERTDGGQAMIPEDEAG